MYCGLPKPSFDPFDSVLEVDIAALYSDSTVETVGDCSGFQLIKNHGQHSTYYGIDIYLNSVNKGLIIPLETPIPVPINIDSIVNLQVPFDLLTEKNNYITTIKQLPFDTIKVDSILNIYHLTSVALVVNYNTNWGRNDYFLACEDQHYQEYIFEFQYDPIWLGRRFWGKRRLFFQTTITRESLQQSYYQ